MDNVIEVAPLNAQSQKALQTRRISFNNHVSGDAVSRGSGFLA
jgi:hypothetical protein